MKRDPRVLLWDAKQSAEAIARFLADKSIDDYRADEILRSAVERQFEILGEALARLSNVSADLAARITDLRRAIAFRNLLIHGYDVVDDLTVWRTARDDLPLLRDTVSMLLAELDQGSRD